MNLETSKHPSNFDERIAAFKSHIATAHGLFEKMEPFNETPEGILRDLRNIVSEPTQNAAWQRSYGPHNDEIKSEFYEGWTHDDLQALFEELKKIFDRSNEEYDIKNLEEEIRARREAFKKRWQPADEEEESG